MSKFRANWEINRDFADYRLSMRSQTSFNAVIPRSYGQIPCEGSREFWEPSRDLNCRNRQNSSRAPIGSLARRRSEPRSSQTVAKEMLLSLWTARRGQLEISTVVRS